jgi:transcriptional regulator with XRE-family HTH domain
MDLKKIIANNIFILRCQNKLTQDEFVSKLKNPYTRSQLSNIETGKNMPSAEFIYDVSKAFYVDVNWILDTHNTNYPNIDLDIVEINFALNYRNLSKESKAVLTSMMDILNKNNC